MSLGTIIWGSYLIYAFHARYKAGPDNKNAMIYRAMHAWLFVLTVITILLLLAGSIVFVLPGLDPNSLSHPGYPIALAAVSCLTLACIGQFSGYGVGLRKIPDSITSRLPKSWFNQIAPHAKAVAETTTSPHEPHGPAGYAPQQLPAPAIPGQQLHAPGQPAPQQFHAPVVPVQQLHAPGQPAPQQLPAPTNPGHQPAGQQGTELFLTQPTQGAQHPQQLPSPYVDLAKAREVAQQTYHPQPHNPNNTPHN